MIKEIKKGKTYKISRISKYYTHNIDLNKLIKVNKFLARDVRHPLYITISIYDIKI